MGEVSVKTQNSENEVGKEQLCLKYVSFAVVIQTVFSFCQWSFLGHKALTTLALTAANPGITWKAHWFSYLALCLVLSNLSLSCGQGSKNQVLIQYLELLTQHTDNSLSYVFWMDQLSNYLGRISLEHLYKDSVLGTRVGKPLVWATVFLSNFDNSRKNNGQYFWGKIAPRLYNNHCLCFKPSHDS